MKPEETPRTHTEGIKEDKKNRVCPLLASLVWAAENSLLSGINLAETPENAQLNHRCKVIRAKIRGGPQACARSGVGAPAPGPSPRSGSDSGSDMRSVDAASLAVSAQGLTVAVTMHEQTRLARQEQQVAHSQLRPQATGPVSQAGCQAHDGGARNVGLQHERHHQGEEPGQGDPAVRRQNEEMERDRCQRVPPPPLSLQRISVSRSQFVLASPGGLTGFMFHPPCEMSLGGASGTAREKQPVRDRFRLPVEDEWISHCLKKEWCVVPRNTHHLEIVLKAWKDLIELCTVKHSIATAGLPHSPKSFEAIC